MQLRVNSENEKKNQHKWAMEEGGDQPWAPIIQD